MNYSKLMFNASFIRMQNQSTMLSRMLGGSNFSVGKKVRSPFAQTKPAGMSASEQIALLRKRYDTFSWESSPEPGKAADDWKIRQHQAMNVPTISKASPQATLEDVSSAFSKARKANHEKLNDAGSEIIAVNTRAGERLGKAGTPINGKQYDFRSTEYVTGGAFIGEYDRNLFNRQMVNRQIGNILSENGITVSDGEDYTFTVDAYSKRISVSGTDDAKSMAMERALNKGENGKNLYDHIRMCGTLENNKQITTTG